MRGSRQSGSPYAALSQSPATPHQGVASPQPRFGLHDPCRAPVEGAWMPPWLMTTIKAQSDLPSLGMHGLASVGPATPWNRIWPPRAMTTP